MKILLHLCLLSTLSILLNLDVHSQCPVLAPDDQSIGCGSSTTLTASNNFVTYSYSTTSCTPIAITGTNAFPTSCDDCVTGQIPIGFSYDFFGTTYTTAVIQSNGLVGFGPFTFTGYSPFAIPNGGNPNNYIAGFFCDIDIRFGGTISYETIGVAPNRQFVVSYDNVVPYDGGGAAGTGTASFQIVLNENGSFNIIISQVSANWNASTSGANATSGTEDATGANAFSPPALNNTDWPGYTPAEQICYLYNPQACTFTHWLEGTTVLTTSTALTVTPGATTTYTAEWDCSGNSCTDNTTVTITGVPSPTHVTHCQNEPSQALAVSASCFAAGSGVLVAQGDTFNTGSLSATDLTWNRNSGGASCDGSAGTDNYYDVVSFTVSANGSYTFDMCTPGTNWDGHASLYQNSFDGTDPCGTSANFILADDDGNAGGNCDNDAQLTANLVTGVTYYIVTTSFSTGTTGNYEWTYTGPGGANISVGGASVTAPMNWYTVATGGSVLSTGTSFNPVGFAGSGLSNTNVPGVYTYYAACSESTSCRVPVVYTITAGPTGSGVTLCEDLASQAMTSAFVCGLGETPIAQGTTFNSGALSGADLTWNRGGGGTTCNSTSGTDEFYDVFSFTVSAAGSYTLDMCTPGTNWDGHASLYQNSFDGTDPCGTPANFILANDDGNAGGNCDNDARLTANLVTGVTYFIVTTSFSSGVTGNYEWTYLGPGGATINIPGSPGSLAWYTAASGGTAIGTGGSFNPVGVAGSGLLNTNTVGTTTYYLACSDAPTCRSNIDYVIEPDHTISAASSQSICINTAMTNITMTIGGGATGATVTGLPAGVTASVSGVTLTLAGTPTASGTFNYSVSTTGNGCDVATTNATLTIDSPSIAPTGISGATTVCLGGATTLTATGGTLGTGASYQWFTGSCNGVAAGTGASISVSPVANTTYYVNASASGSGSCPVTACINTSISLPTTGTALSQNNEAASCLVDQNNFIHFFHSSGRLLASINSNGQDLGNVTISSYVPGAPIDVSACNSSSPFWITATMGRHWLITPQFQPATPVTVRLPYDDSPGGELDQLITESGTNQNIYDDVLVPADVKLSKYSGPSNVNSNPYDNCFVVGGAAIIHTQTTTGNVQSYLPGFNLNSRYADFSITGFSEFWLHGSTINSPLPVEISDINLNCTADDKSITLSWTTLSEINNSEFRIERSFNGTDWVVVGEQTGAGNSNSSIDYVYIEEKTSQLSYYRLIQVDYDGTLTYYDPLTVQCSGNNTIAVTPNPVHGEFELSLYSAVSLENSKLLIIDGLGKVVKSEDINISVGNSTHKYDLSNLSSGIYLMYLKSPNSEFNPIRIVKTN